jgi:hypothetical protein
VVGLLKLAYLRLFINAKTTDMKCILPSDFPTQANESQLAAQRMSNPALPEKVFWKRFILLMLLAFYSTASFGTYIPITATTAGFYTTSSCYFVYELPASATASGCGFLAYQSSSTIFNFYPGASAVRMHIDHLDPGETATLWVITTGGGSSHFDFSHFGSLTGWTGSCSGSTTTSVANSLGDIVDPSSSSSSSVQVDFSSADVGGADITGIYVTYSGGTFDYDVSVVPVPPIPSGYLMTGGGTYCYGASGVHIGLNSSTPAGTIGSFTSTYYLLNSSGSRVVGPISGTGAALDFGLITTPGTYTVEVIEPGFGCGLVAGSETVIADPAITPYAITGSGTTCTGGPSLTLGLSGSDVGTSYKLSMSTVGPYTISGTGSAIAFHTFATPYPMTDAGSVVATDAAGCTATMPGSTSVTIQGALLQSIVGSGSACTGGSGGHVYLSPSQIGITYQLYNGTTPVGSPVAGTGSSLTFTCPTPGTYTVTAFDAVSGCTSPMYGSVIITPGITPTVYSLAGGGGYCAGGSGLDIQLSNSDYGVNYQLYNGSTPVGSSVPGTGSMIDFGYQTAGGTYTVLATNATTGCTSTTAGTTITVWPTPTIYTMTASPYCFGSLGSDIQLSLSDVGVSYQLFQGSTPVGPPIAGTGSSIDFGYQTVTGPYTIVATITATGCTATMGSTVVSIIPLPIVYVVSPGGSFCAGGTGIPVTLSSSDVGITYQLYNGSTLVSTFAGTGGLLNFGLQTAAGTYTIVAIDRGCSSTMLGAAVIMVNPLPTAYTISPASGIACPPLGVDIQLSNSDLGTTYTLYNGTSPVLTLAGLGVPPLDFGFQTAAGVYTVDAITSFGCTATMIGSATIVTGTPPGPITGMATPFCVGSTITLHDAVPGGTWDTRNHAIATIDAAGNLTGLTGGATVVSYTTACGTKTASIIVTAPPGAITGLTTVCLGMTITLHDTPPGGTWTSSNPTIATVNTAGKVTGLAIGTSTISYANGCGTATLTVSVIAIPTAIAGVAPICVGSTIALTEAATGGSWISSDISVATVDATGLVTGLAAGTANISYINSCGFAIIMVTVNPSPAAITGPTSVCIGSAITLSDATSGGSWSSTGVYGTIDPATGVLTGVHGPGTETVSYTIGGCSVTYTVLVGPIVSVAIDESSPFVLSGDRAYTYCFASTSPFTLQASTTPSGLVGAVFSWYDLGTSSVVSATSSYTTSYTATGSAVTHSYSVSVSYGGCPVSTIVDVVVAPNTVCTPCRYFTVDSLRKDDTLTPIGAPCPSCGAIQPFHTITASSLNSSNVHDYDNYYIVNNAILAKPAYTGDQFYMNGGVTLDLDTSSSVIDLCHFSASPLCMWRGINVDVTRDSAGSLTLTNSLVENAGDGLTAGVNIIHGGSAGSRYFAGMANILTARGSIFNSNYAGISINGYQPSVAATLAGTTLPIEIDSCVFTHRKFDGTPVLGSTALTNYPFVWPVSGLLRAASGSTANPTFGLDNYAKRIYAPSLGEGHGGIFVLNSGANHLVSGITTTAPNVFDYNYVLVGNTTPDASYANTNVFDNMMFGVQVQNGNAIFNNNTFRQLAQGIAVYNQDNDVQITGSSYTTTDHTNNRFYQNYQVAVHCEANAPAFLMTPNDFTCMNAEFSSDADTSNGAIDMDLFVPASHNIHKISHNKIYNYSEGINIYHTGTISTSDFDGYTYVDHNIIAGKSAPTYSEEVVRGIDFGDGRSYSGSSGNGEVYIEDNQLDGVQNGIQFNSTMQKGFVDRNTVNLADYGSSRTKPTGLVWGIYVNMAPFLQAVKDNIAGAWGFDCNTVNATTLNSYLTVGMFADAVGSTGNTVDMSCNAVHDVVIGFNFKMANIVDWSNNEMMLNTYGMYLYGGGAKIFTQGSSCLPSDNHWDEPCGACALSPCGNLWHTWTTTANVYQTYVSAGAGAIFSPLNYRTTSMPGMTFNITNNGAQAPAFPYGFTPGSLLPSLCTTLVAPVVCADHTVSGFRMDPGADNKTITEAGEYVLYPNPSDGHFQITRSGGSTGSVSVVVVNAVGQRVYSGAVQFANGAAAFSLNNVVPGMYLVQLVDEKGLIWNKKVIIEKGY